MHSKVRTVILSALKFGIPVAIIWYLVAKVTPEQWDTLLNSPKRPGYLVTALVVGFVSVLLSFLRWGLLVRSHRIEITALDSIRLGAVGFLLSFVSAGSVGGDVFKAFFLAQRSPGKRIEAFASALVDRIVGLYGLLVVSSLALLCLSSSLEGEDLGLVRLSIYGLTVGGAAVMVAIIFGGRLIDAVLDRLSDVPLIGPFVHRVADPLRAFREHTGVFLFAIGISVFIHGLLSISIHLIAAGLYTQSPSLLEHLLVVPLANAFAALPIAPGGVGVFEGALQHLYQSLPNMPAQVSGTVVGLIFEIVKLLIAVVGICIYWSGDSEIQRSLHAAEESSEDEIFGGEATPTQQPERSVTNGDVAAGA